MVSVFFIISATSCNRSKKENNRKLTQSENQNIISLFDGKTLNGWEITKFGTEGPVQVTDGKIVLAMGDGLTGITWSKDFPKINYVVSLEAMKMSGIDFFCGITFPVDTTFCSFIVGGWGGPVVGLSTVDGKDASENETKTLKNFEKNVWYKIRLKVMPDKIEAWINDEKMVDFTTKNHTIGIRPEVELSKPFGIASWITTAALRNIHLEILNEK
jgi:hypothetical protein